MHLQQLVLWFRGFLFGPCVVVGLIFAASHVQAAPIPDKTLSARPNCKSELKTFPTPKNRWGTALIRKGKPGISEYHSGTWDGDSYSKRGIGRAGPLDSCRSVAADLRLYPLGTVLYIPQLVGFKCADGKVSDGYLVVADSGGFIKGAGRFDLFIGRCQKASNGICNDGGFKDRYLKLQQDLGANGLRFCVVASQKLPPLALSTVNGAH